MDRSLEGSRDARESGVEESDGWVAGAGTSASGWIRAIWTWRQESASPDEPALQELDGLIDRVVETGEGPLARDEVLCAVERRPIWLDVYGAVAEVATMEAHDELPDLPALWEALRAATAGGSEDVPAPSDTEPDVPRPPG